MSRVKTQWKKTKLETPWKRKLEEVERERKRKLKEKERTEAEVKVKAEAKTKAEGITVEMV